MSYARPEPQPILTVGLVVTLTAIMLTGVMIWAAGVRISGTPTNPRTAAVLASRDLRFEDRIDGTITVVDVKDNSDVAQLARGSNNFVRALMRGLAQQRIRENVGANVPFRLTAWADGRLTLDDPSTGRKVELESFGETNERAFAGFLPLRLTTPTVTEGGLP